MIRIELGDGDYAIVYPEMIHRTSRLLQKNILNTLGADGYQKLQADLKAAPDYNAQKAIIAKVAVEGEQNIILLNQVSEWSFGAVTEQVLDTMPSRKFDLLATEVEKLYSQPPLAGKA